MGRHYSYRFKASGRPAPTYAVASGRLPTGLALDRATGVLSGTPAKAGTFRFAVVASNSAGRATTSVIVLKVDRKKK